MKGTDVIFINGNECTRCWRCIRECPVKAIDAAVTGAVINGVRCTGCGQCISVCRYGAVKQRDDIITAKALIKRHAVKVASVSPQWVTEMDGIDESRLVEALKLLGFTHVSESALGAQLTLEKEMQLVAEREYETISARCPAIVSYIEKYAPRHKNLLAGVITPMEAHAAMIKNWWGNGACIVHFSACAAAKSQAEEAGSLVDAALTFGELKKWLREEGIESANLFGNPELRFVPHVAKTGTLYPLCGEEANGCGTPSFAASPLQSVTDIMRHYRRADKSVWLDFMACRGGCTGSGASSCRSASPVAETVAMRENAASREKIDEYYNLPHIRLAREDEGRAEVEDFVAESETLFALEELGMPTRASQTDCNACGYGTCRRFAKALSRGEVDKQMCWYYLKYGVTTKLETLVSKISSGVAIINSSLEIEQANRVFASLMGPQTEALFDSRQGIGGQDARKILPFANLVSSVLDSGEESLVRDVQIGEKLITVSVHTIQKNRLVLVICRNMLFSQVRNEEIVKRTQRVIDENLETVRKIALLLGENASRTEAILNSILEASVRENG